MLPAHSSPLSPVTVTLWASKPLVTQQVGLLIQGALEEVTPPWAQILKQNPCGPEEHRGVQTHRRLEGLEPVWPIPSSRWSRKFHPGYPPGKPLRSQMDLKDSCSFPYQSTGRHLLSLPISVQCGSSGLCLWASIGSFSSPRSLDRLWVSCETKVYQAIISKRLAHTPQGSNHTSSVHLGDCKAIRGPGLQINRDKSSLCLSQAWSAWE